MQKNQPTSGCPDELVARAAVMLIISKAREHDSGVRGKPALGAEQSGTGNGSHELGTGPLIESVPQPRDVVAGLPVCSCTVICTE